MISARKAPHGIFHGALVCSQCFFVAVQNFPDEALEEELRSSGVPVAQGGIHPVGGEIPLPGVQPHDGFALAAGRLLAEGHHLPGQAPACPGKPRGILCHTLKGKGVSFMEGKNTWHGKAIDDESFAKAMEELGGAVNA